jgi:hypothetical protein
MFNKVKIQWIVSLVLIIVFIQIGCKSGNKDQSLIISENDVPEKWADMALYIAKNTPANSPTFASRGFGYIGVTMYESIVHGFKNKKSLAGQLNQLNNLPFPDSSKKYSWGLALNAGQAFILKNIYLQTSDENKLMIDSLETLISNSFKFSEKDTNVINRSISYGKEVAAAIYEWSKTDDGHRGYLKNFDTKLEMPSSPGCWKPPFYGQTISRFPLHPHWGDNRTFLKADSNWKMPIFIKYDKTKGGDYYKQFEEVYTANKKLTEEQKEIAMWWNDDPSDTYTPPGHSFNLATIVLRTKKADLITCAETYARTGMAVADAFIVCWRMKYKFCTERPSSYISENIDPAWESFWPDPPFPAFPSGHATQAGAVATVMTGYFGDKMEIMDTTHSRRGKDKLRNVWYKTRYFNSFWQVAEETAYSRFLGGIHCRQDNEVGLQEGGKVGRNINSLIWNKQLAQLNK